MFYVIITRGDGGNLFQRAHKDSFLFLVEGEGTNGINEWSVGIHI